MWRYKLIESAQIGNTNVYWQTSLALPGSGGGLISRKKRYVKLEWPLMMCGLSSNGQSTQLATTYMTHRYHHALQTIGNDI